MNRGGTDREVHDLQARVAELEELQTARERELVEHSARLVESMRELRQKTGILESVLAGMADAVAVADTTGKFLLFNPEAERLLRMGQADVPLELWSVRYGCYLPDEVTPYPPEELPLARAIRGEEVNGTIVFIRHEGLPEGLWLSVNGRPMRDETGAICGGVVVMRDVTAQVQANRRRDALHAVTGVLAESATLDEATPRILRALCESAGWDFGAIWELDREGGVVRCVDLWRRPGVPCDDFEAATREVALTPDMGLPGRVWAGRQPVWVADVARDGNFPRAAAAARNGLHAGFGFPILYTNGELGGVIEIFSRRMSRPDDELLAMFASLGSQIGQFIERKIAEEELREARERFELAVRGSGDGLWDWDVRSNTVYFSPRWKEMLGYADDEIAHTYGEWEGRVHPDDLERALATIRDYFNDPAAVTYELEHRLRRRDGSYCWFLARGVALRDGAGRPYRMAGSHTDITPRKQMERRLRDEEALYHSLVETLPLNIFRKDRDGRFTFGNSRFLQELGKTLDEVRGKTDFDFYPAALAEKYRADDVRVMQTGEVFETTEEHVRPGGEKMYVQVLKTPVHDARQRVVGTQAIYWDVTDRKRAEEALHRAREAAEAASRAKSTFLANMSHEIRTPMGAVIGMTELVLDTPLTEEQRDYLEIVRKSADALLAVINDILDFSKIEADKMDLDRVPFDLRELLGDTLSTLALRAHQKGLELAGRVAPEVPPAVVGDPNRLRQVFVNLIGNAIKFTERGEVVVEVKKTEDRRQKTEGAGILTSDFCLLEFSVRDTGIGIPSDKQQMIFDPFSQVDGGTTRKYDGAGLGLAISSRLVAMMGGRISVESDPGRSSTFRFALPLEPAGAPPARPVHPERLRGLSVLVVDDNATNRRILEETLLGWEMRPTCAAGAEEALAALEEGHRAGTPFALVLLDAQMPGTDGFMLAERIQERPELTALATVMMLSSAGQPGNMARRREVGITTHLTKPVKQAELWKAILAALGEGEAEREARKEVSEGHSAGRGALPSPRTLHILLAEDNPFNQKLALGLLGRVGHSLVVVKNGAEAVAALERDSFDLVLMDVQMPEMDGFQATKLIREREVPLGRHTPILAMTAYAMKGDRERCLAAGMDGYVSKPIRAHELIEAIAAAVGAASPDPPDGSEPLTPGEAPDWESALERVGGDRELLVELVRLYLQECPGWLADMRRGLQAGDAVMVKRVAHNLKSCLGNFGARAGFERALRVETMGREGTLAGADEACRALEQSLERLRPALAAFARTE
ncbi:MAG TPA: response regulator [Gemmataceae bacterium]|nr:response regulator [Gemmataceae bacterium]